MALPVLAALPTILGAAAPTAAAAAPTLLAAPTTASILSAMGPAVNPALVSSMTPQLGLMGQLGNLFSMSDASKGLLQGFMQQQQQQQPLTPMQLAQKQMAQIPQIDLMSLLSQLGGK